MIFKHHNEISPTATTHVAEARVAGLYIDYNKRTGNWISIGIILRIP